MILELDFELLTDVCLSSVNHTLGDPETHDCIPGRTLWGAVASQAYRIGLSEDEAFRLFHQGIVRFLTAVPVHSEHRSYPAPAAWHKPKNPEEAGKSVAYFNHSLYEIRKAHEGKQYQPLKSGWYNTQVQPVEVKSTYSLRTAVDPSGKAQEGLLYGLPALSAGTRFWGALMGEDADVQKVAQIFLQDGKGELRLGRSRNAELGLVKVQKRANSIEKLTHGSGQAKRVSLFCVSRCIFRDPKTGAPTLNPGPAAFGLPDDWSMDLDSSFLRSVRVVHFQSKRRRPEVERVAIEKGSVLTFEGGTAIDLSTLGKALDRGVGEFAGQGYGEVLANPTWLMQKDIAPQSVDNSKPSHKVKAPTDELFQWAENRAQQVRQREKLFQEAQSEAKALRKHKVPPAQWGVLRQMAREAQFRGTGSKLAIQVEQFLAKGKRKLSKNWESTDKKLQALMQQHTTDLPVYLELLASACMRPEAPEGGTAQ